jgi:hypothetical protein
MLRNGFFRLFFIAGIKNDCLTNRPAAREKWVPASLPQAAGNALAVAVHAASTMFP